MFLGSLPAVHLFKLADAGPFDRCRGRGVVKRQDGGATASCQRLLGGDCPHSPGLLLLRLVCLLLLSGARGHGLEREQVGSRIRAT